MNALNTVLPTKNKMTSPWAVVSLIAIIWLVSIGVAGPGTLENVLEQGTAIGQAVIEKGAEVEKIVVEKNFETKEIVEQKSSEVIQEIGEIILDDDHTMFVGIGVITLIIIAGIAVATRKNQNHTQILIEKVSRNRN